MVAFALLAVAPTLLLGGLAIHRARRDVQQEVVRGNTALIRAIGQQLNSTLQDTRRALEVAAAALARFPEADALRILRVLRSEFSILRRVTFLNREGNRTLGDPLDSSIKFSLDMANTYGGYVSEVLHIGDSRQVFLVVQARDRKGELSGLLAAVVDLGFVQTSLSEAKLGPGGALLVVDGNGRRVASSGRLPPLVPGRSLRRANPAVDRVLATHTEGHLEFADSGGEDWVAVYRNIAGMSEFRGVRWGVMLLQPTSQAYALARKATRDTLVVALGVLLLALAVGTYLARRITRPLATLVRQTELVAADNLETGFEPPSSADEIGVLARSFATMVSRLRQSRDRLYALTELRENLVRSIPIGVISVDRAGLIQSINPAQEQLSGVEAAAVEGESIYDVFADRQDEAGVLDRLRAVLSGPRREDLTLNNQASPFTCEARMRYRVGISPLRNRRGEVDGAVVLQEDLSERARLEAQLLRSEKLSSVGVLAAGVAHEINNPLTTILGYAKLLLEGLAEDDTDRPALELVADEARRVQEIVRNLLDFSRQDRGEVSAVSLSEVLERTLSLVAPDLRKRQVVVHRQLDPDIPLVLANGRRLEQVFVNLITNAAHAMEGGGDLTLTTGTEPGRDTPVFVDVQDTGAGIPPQIQARVFDPFFTTKEQGQGTGLGLAVSHGIISDSGGDIEVHSEQGQGTTFRVWLQSAQEQGTRNREQRTRN